MPTFLDSATREQCSGAKGACTNCAHEWQLAKASGYSVLGLGQPRALGCHEHWLPWFQTKNQKLTYVFHLSRRNGSEWIGEPWLRSCVKDTATYSGERPHFAHLSDGGNRGNTAVYRHREHQQHCSHLASEWRDGRQCHGRDDFQFRSVHGACDSPEYDHHEKNSVV